METHNNFGFSEVAIILVFIFFLNIVTLVVLPPDSLFFHIFLYIMWITGGLLIGIYLIFFLALLVAGFIIALVKLWHLIHG